MDHTVPTFPTASSYLYIPLIFQLCNTKGKLRADQFPFQLDPFQSRFQLRSSLCRTDAGYQSAHYEYLLCLVSLNSHVQMALLQRGENEMEVRANNSINTGQYSAHTYVRISIHRKYVRMYRNSIRKHFG